MGATMRKFNETERYVLMRKYSRQRIEYWEKRGYVPSQILRIVAKMIGRKVEDLLPTEEKPVSDTDQ